MIFNENLMSKEYDLASEMHLKITNEMLLFQIEPFYFKIWLTLIINNILQCLFNIILKLKNHLKHEIKRSCIEIE
jgi:hypothetical protein